MSRCRHRHAAALVALVLLAALSACGLSENDTPQVIAADEVPSELLAVTPSSSTTLAASPRTASITVYLLVVRDGATHLVPVPREVPEDGAERAGDRLIALLGAVTADETAAGIITSIPSDTVLLDTDLDEESQVLTIELSRSLFDVQGQELRNAFAQLVWTATELEGIRSVRFVVDGEEYRAPDEAGIEQPGAVSRADYRSLAPL